MLIAPTEQNLLLCKMRHFRQVLISAIKSKIAIIGSKSPIAFAVYLLLFWAWDHLKYGKFVGITRALSLKFVVYQPASWAC